MRLFYQLALRFEELQARATEEEPVAETAVAKTTTVAGFTRKHAERATFPDHLSRRPSSRPWTGRPRRRR
ncbi:hypothetical protein [Nitrospirillum amazonense]|uniref:hypothetical protein n=1 Tax=Nitrospirillum amazonense TaxID=28077 RepID=UPI002412C665|nr:hypothetical protein [Nitrospirillum amazonense]MDG3443727.1 hypothetical protein [Nitrospirillum amazonense]